MQHKWTSVDDDQNDKCEDTISKTKRRPHSYLLNEKVKDSENNPPEEEKSDEKVSSNGALQNQMDGKISTYNIF